MNKTILAIFLLVNLCTSNALFLKKPSRQNFDTMAQLREFEEHPFGKKILDTVALQLNNQAPLSEIAKMLGEIRAGLASEKQKATSVHNKRESECADFLSKQKAKFNKAEAAKNGAQAEIQILNREISTLKAQVKNLDSQISILNSREVALKAARERDRADYERRKQQGPQVIEALELIIDKLSTIQPTKDGRTVLAELSKIGSSNPIQALIQIASGFSEDALNKVITTLDNLRTSISEALKDDAANEAEAEAEFRHLLGEIGSTRTQVASALTEAKNTLKSKESNLEIQKNILADSIQKMDEATQAITEKEAQCEAWRSKWADDDAQYAKEIAIIKQVEAYLAQHLGTMKDYIKDRAAGF